MTIGIDCGSLSGNDLRLHVGVYRVTINLLNYLLKHDLQNSYRVYTFGKKQKLPVINQHLLDHKVFAYPFGYQTIQLPLELSIHPTDVFLGLSQMIPFMTRKTFSIGFIYDLAFLYDPISYSDSYEQLKKQTNNVIMKSDIIVTISHSAKRDILEQYTVDPKKVVVNYPGIDSRFSHKGEKTRNQNPYILFVGSLTKSKDIPLALEAFSEFLQRIGSIYDFYIIGGDYWYDQNISDTLKKLKLENRVKLVGYVSDEALPNYYRGAKAYLATSKREGFCLPVAEAMACGLPVVVVDRGSLTEVVGNSGIVVRNYSPHAIAVELVHVVTDRKRRAEFRKRGILRARQFRWESFGRRVHEVILQYYKLRLRYDH